MTDRQISLYTAAVYQTIKEVGAKGAPGGLIYSALMTHGVNMETYERIMASLVSSKQVVKRGDCYFPTKEPS